MKNEKETTDLNKMGIIFSIVGIIASILVIIINIIDGESKTLGIVLLCACSATLSANVVNRKNNR